MRTGFHRAFAFTATFAVCATASMSAFAQDSYGLYDGGSYFGSAIQSDEMFEGWWLGGTIGGSSVSYSLSPGTVDSDGVIGGVVGGFSWQHGPAVIGIEGDYLASNIDGGGVINGAPNRAKVGFDSMADLRLRLGWTIMPNLLLFGTVGGALANADLYVSGPGGGFKDTTFTGWSVGAGAEYAYDKDWSLRFDYQFTDFGKETITYQGGKQTFDPDSNSLRGSLIYRF
ncbi:MAG: outer membrane beta-barrel protein [Methyloceanibacter sp.]|jgi:outer membrane immunogenic protein|uniref:outer membrane protein n=1 Tax=Methyloceanibacter sp. TaxID=1965321 RepID=UPI003C632521